MNNRLLKHNKKLRNRLTKENRMFDKGNNSSELKKDGLLKNLGGNWLTVIVMYGYVTNCPNTSGQNITILFCLVSFGVKYLSRSWLGDYFAEHSKDCVT